MDDALELLQTTIARMRESGEYNEADLDDLEEASYMLEVDELAAPYDGPYAELVSFLEEKLPNPSLGDILTLKDVLEKYFGAVVKKDKNKILAEAANTLSKENGFLFLKPSGEDITPVFINATTMDLISGPIVYALSAADTEEALRTVRNAIIRVAAEIFGHILSGKFQKTIETIN